MKLRTLWIGAALAGAPLAVSGQANGNTTYEVYVAAESADLLHRLRLGPEGFEVVNTSIVGELPSETEGPHGLRVSPDGRFLYMTTAHGLPDGKFWKLHAGPDTVVGDPFKLGRFPATLDVTPDGLYAFVANFNLHGAHVPSSISTVFTEDGMEVAQTETCVMPHGARLNPDGSALYSACMMDDQIIELDTYTYQVARRFGVSLADPGPIESHHSAMGEMHHQGGEMAPTCSPTWTEPAPNGRHIYVACNGGDEIFEIDAESWAVSRRFETGSGPYNLAVTPDSRLLVATLKKAHMVEFFDLESGESLARVATSTTIPHGVVVSPDGRYAFVSVEGVGMDPGKVDVFDLSSLERVHSVEVGQQAGGIAFWKTTP